MIGKIFMAAAIVFSMFALWFFWGGALMALGFMGASAGMLRMPTMGGSPTPAGVGKAGSSIKGLTLVDSIAREGDISAVDTWTALQSIGASSVGDIKVPIDAKVLSRVDVVVSGDVDNTITNGMACTTGFRLSGNGLTVGGVHRYLGPAFTGGGKTAGEAACRSKVVSLATKIAVKGGNEIAVEGIMFGEDVGTLTMAVAFTFTVNARDYGVEDGDIREGDITAVDTDTILTAVGASTLGNIKIPVERNTIAAVQGVIAVDVGADNTATVRGAALFQIAGPALSEGGNFRFLSEAVEVAAVTTGVFLTCMEPDPTPLDVIVKGGNELELHAMVIGEDPGSVSVAVGLLYGSVEGGLM